MLAFVYIAHSIKKMMAKKKLLIKSQKKENYG